MPELHQLCDRMTKAEIEINLHKQRMDEFHTSLQENTAMTKKGLEVAEKGLVVNQTTADNTAELVEIFKGFKIVKSFVLWLIKIGVGIGVPIWGFIEFIRHFK